MKMLILFWGIICAVLLPITESVASSSFAIRLCSREFRQNPPKTEIVYNFGALKIERKYSAEELYDLMKEIYPKTEETVHMVNGLTRLSPYISVESSIAEKKIGSHKCYYPQSVRVIVGYEPIVYIRNDLAENTCRYNITLRHERTHLDIGNLSLRHFLRDIKRQLPQIVKDTGVLVKSSGTNEQAAESSAELNDKYHQRLNVLFDSFVQDMVKQQSRIDTIESYDFEGALCPPAP